MMPNVTPLNTAVKHIFPTNIDQIKSESANTIQIPNSVAIHNSQVVNGHTVLMKPVNKSPQNIISHNNNFEYLKQLLQDKNVVQVYPKPLVHAERLLDEGKIINTTELRNI